MLDIMQKVTVKSVRVEKSLSPLQEQELRYRFKILYAKLNVTLWQRQKMPSSDLILHIHKRSSQELFLISLEVP